MTYMRHPDDSLASLDQALCADIEAVADALLGPANRKFSTRTQLRFGSKGALCVWIAGPKKGRWADFSGADKGRVLGLVRYALRCEWPEAITWAQSRTGQPAGASYTATGLHPERLVKQAAKAAKAAAEAATDVARRIGSARRLWHSSTAVTGPAAAYLTRTRMIPAPILGWPFEAVRFHKPSLSLILAATADDGGVQAVQRVYLTNAGCKIDEAEIEARRLPAVKQTNGVMAGAWIKLPGDPKGPLQLAEGPETGLTVWRATGHETWIALGSVAKLSPPAGRNIIVCADDDPRHAQLGKSNNAHTARAQAVASWHAAGGDVQLLYPWPVRRTDKSDFNDLIKIAGLDAVRGRIELALNPLRMLPNRVPVTETRAALQSLSGRFFDAAFAWHPPAKGEEGPPPLVVATDPGVGAGKSAASHRHAVDLVLKLRAAGDFRAVVIATPTHALSIGQAKLIRALPGAEGLIVRVWHARNRADPDQPGKAMCHDPEAVKDARDAGANVQEAVCGNIKTGCPRDCGYRKQAEFTADIWLVSHELLFIQKPAGLGAIAALVIDEGFLKAGLFGTDGKDGIQLTVDSLRQIVEIEGERAKSTAINELKRRQGEPDVDDRSDLLNRARRKRLAAIEGAPGGWLLKSRLIAAGLTANEATQAKSLTQMLLVDPGLFPGMAPADRKAAVEASRGNRSIKHDSMLWDAIAEQLHPNGPELSGNAEIVDGDTEHGKARMIRLKGRKHIRKGWRVPTLVIDATFKLGTVAPFFPNVQFQPTPPSAAPLQRITQVNGKSYATTGLIGGSGETEIKRRAKRLAELRAWIVLKARTTSGTVLVVMQKAVETAMLELGPLPDNVSTGHHNALRGSNEHEHVRVLIVIGRTQPPPQAVEQMREALSGEGIQRSEGYYPQADAIREGADGKAELVSADRHPDPLAEAIRWQICEGELIQLIGRGRGVNRTAADPLDVFVLTDVPLPLPVDRIITANDLELTIAEAQLAAGGAAFATPAHALAAYPDMWKSPDAARKAFQREASEIQSGTNPNVEPLIGECPTLETWRYQIAGPRQHPAIVHVDRSVVANPAAHIAAALEATLAVCELVKPVEADPAATAETIHEGLPPAALYGRGVLEPPPETMLTLRSRHNYKIVLAEIEVPAMGPLFAISPLMARGYGPPLLVRRPGFSVRDMPHMIRRRPPEAAGMRM